MWQMYDTKKARHPYGCLAIIIDGKLLTLNPPNFDFVEIESSLGND